MLGLDIFRQRQEETEIILTQLGNALAGQGSFITITGQTGVGKSYLMREVGRIALNTGYTVKSSTCMRYGSEPEGTFRRLVSDLPKGIKISDPDFPLIFLQCVKRDCSRTPNLLILDDLHWADAAFMGVLIYISRNIVDLPVVLIGSYNSDQLEEWSERGNIPLIDGLRVLRREGLCKEVQLPPFDRSKLIRVLEVEQKEGIDSGLAEIIWERSEGNPRIALELMRFLIKTRQVELRDGIWVGSGPLSLDVPDGYTELVVRKVERLSPDDQRLLEIASVIGNQFSPMIIAQLQQKGLLEVLERLEHLCHDQQLVEEMGEYYRFTHGASRRVLLSQISSLRIKEIHRMVGKVLEMGCLPEATFEDVSEHYFNAEIRDKCVCFSLLSGQQSLAEGSWERAIKDFQKVLDATADGGFEEERRMSIQGMAYAQRQLNNRESNDKGQRGLGE